MDCSPPGSSVHGDSPGKNTGVGCCALLQGIFPTQGSNWCLFCLLHWQVGSLSLAPTEKPKANLTMKLFLISRVWISPSSPCVFPFCCSCLGFLLQTTGLLILALVTLTEWSQQTNKRIDVKFFAKPKRSVWVPAAMTMTIMWEKIQHLFRMQRFSKIVFVLGIYIWTFRFIALVSREHIFYVQT